MSAANIQIYTDVVIKQFRALLAASFFDLIPSYDHLINKSQSGEVETINLTDIGADPNVLIDNTSYPIGIQSQNDENIAITLKKYETENTGITDDELKYIAYGKVALVTKKHVDALNITKFKRGIHALSPANASSTEMPVITTSGETVDGRKRLTKKDVVGLKSKLDKLEVPMENRILVLCLSLIHI